MSAASDNTRRHNVSRNCSGSVRFCASYESRFSPEKQLFCTQKVNKTHDGEWFGGATNSLPELSCSGIISDALINNQNALPST